MIALLLAAGLAVPTAESIEMKICYAIERQAEKIMSLRQRGLSLAEFMSEIDKSKNKKLGRIKPMVIAAYSVPRYETAGMIAKAIDDFKDEQFLACIKSMGNKPL